eukprot:scaffold231617_cov15-Prasinocladus_malaysianus.AAC.1
MAVAASDRRLGVAGRGCLVVLLSQCGGRRAVCIGGHPAQQRANFVLELKAADGDLTVNTPPRFFGKALRGR